MVGKNSLQLLFIFKEPFERARGQLCESWIGGSENGEWARTLQGVDESGFSECFSQRVELPRSDCCLDNVFVGRGECERGVSMPSVRWQRMRFITPPEFSEPVCSYYGS